MTETIEHEAPVCELSLEPQPERQMPAVPQQPNTPMAMLSMAVAQGADIDKLEKLMALNERWQAAEAKKAFTAAMAAFKANPPTVGKDMENKQYGSRYTSIGNMVNTINAALSPHGLSARWDIHQEVDSIEVTCILSHSQGHSEQCSIAGPPDNSGKKNPLQEIKSTATYLKLATFEAVTGTASSEVNKDDDGNGSGEKGIPEGAFMDHCAAIDSASDLAALQSVFAVAYRAAEAAKDRPAKVSFISKKDARKKALSQ